MHTITKKPITLDCFETGDLCDISELDIKHGEIINNYNGEVSKNKEWDKYISWTYDDAFNLTCSFVEFLEDLRKKFLLTGDKRYWKELIRWIPESWLQTRTVTMSYENIYAMLHQRSGHKLTEWSKPVDEESVVLESFVQMAHSLPYVDAMFFDEL